MFHGFTLVFYCLEQEQLFVYLCTYLYLILHSDFVDTHLNIITFIRNLEALYIIFNNSFFIKKSIWHKVMSLHLTNIECNTVIHFLIEKIMFVSLFSYKFYFSLCCIFMFQYFVPVFIYEYFLL